MKIYFVKLKEKPARRHRGVNQERSYATEADRQRAMTLLRKQMLHGRRKWLNVFTNGCDDQGRPKLYCARNFTPQEVAAAGLDYEEMYADILARNGSVPY